MGIDTKANTRAAAHPRLVICVSLRMAASAVAPSAPMSLAPRLCARGRVGNGERVGVSMGADNSPFALGSVDGHALQIDELKGTKPTEKIDLSNKRLGVGVASAIIIASCIKENGVLKELKCAAARVFAFMSMPIDTPTLSPSPPHPSLAVSEAT